MKKIPAVIAALIIMLHTVSGTAYSQKDIYTALNNACRWMDNDASPLMFPGVSASDHYIIALSRMGRTYESEKYLDLCASRKPASVMDGQRLILTETACGGAVPDDVLKIFTYDPAGGAAELAGAITALDSGKYSVKEKDKSKDQLVTALLALQQPDGSFDSDVYTTALSVIALSPYDGLKYEVSGKHKNDVTVYNAQSALINAAAFLQNSKNGDCGYDTVRVSAFVLMALDSIGIDGGNDAGFSENGSSLLGWILSQQNKDGSFNGSADDTAFAVCALVSHLRAMQGAAPFFEFSSGDKPNLAAAKDGAEENLSGRGLGSSGEETPMQRIVNAVDGDTQSENGTEEPSAVSVPAPSPAPRRGLLFALTGSAVISAGAAAYIFIRLRSRRK